jgi:CubicO group peptidase (beta-lactamase class C family)
MPLAYQPGTTWDDSNSTDVLGRVIEVVSGQALSQHLGPQVTRTELYLPGPGYTFGLGFAVRTEAGMAPFEGSIGEYFWGGAGGTYMWVDPGADLIVVFGMQSPKQRTLYRSVLRNLVFGAVVGPAAETPGH